MDGEGGKERPAWGTWDKGLQAQPPGLWAGALELSRGQRHVGAREGGVWVTFRIKRSPDSAGAKDSFKHWPWDSVATSASSEKPSGSLGSAARGDFSGWMVLMSCVQGGGRYLSVCTTCPTAGCLTPPHALARPPSAATCHGAAAPCREALMGDRTGCQEVTPHGRSCGALPPRGDPTHSNRPPPVPMRAQAAGRMRGCSRRLQGEETAGRERVLLLGPSPRPSPLYSPCPDSVQYVPFLRPFSPHHQLNSLIPTGDKRIFHCNLLLIQRKTGFGRGEAEVGKREGGGPTRSVSSGIPGCL